MSSGRITTLEEMVRHIFYQILKETKNRAKFFGKHIKKETSYPNYNLPS